MSEKKTLILEPISSTPVHQVGKRFFLEASEVTKGLEMVLSVNRITPCLPV